MLQIYITYTSEQSNFFYSVKEFNLQIATEVEIHYTLLTAFTLLVVCYVNFFQPVISADLDKTNAWYTSQTD